MAFVDEPGLGPRGGLRGRERVRLGMGGGIAPLFERAEEGEPHGGEERCQHEDEESAADAC